MLTLSFDCSTLEGSVALTDGPLTYFSQSWRRQRAHGEVLTGTIQKAFELSGKKLSDLELVAVGHGPGSFTGVRVAINAAKTLGYALNLPVVSISSLEIIGQQAALSKKPLVTILNAYDNRVFTMFFRPGKSGWIRKTQPRAVTLEEFEALIKSPTLCLGEGYLDLSAGFSKRLRTRLLRDDRSRDFPSAVTLGALAQTKVKKGETLVWKDVEAVYVRASGAEEKLRRGALKPLPESIF